MIPVQGHDHLFRDEKTGAIVNEDQSSYQTYMQMKKKKKKDRAEIDEIKNDISDLNHSSLSFMESSMFIKFKKVYEYMSA